MKAGSRLTLAQWFALSSVALAIVLALALSGVVALSRRSILKQSDRARDAAAQRIDAELSRQLGEGTAALDDVARAMRFGALQASDPRAMEARLYSELLDRPTVSDITFTHASKGDLAARPAASPRDVWQVTVYRGSVDAGSELLTRRTLWQDGAFVSDVRRRAPQGGLLSAPWVREGGTLDPTVHPTFETTVDVASDGHAIWSDLSFSELDMDLPKDRRRVVVTVQQTVVDEFGAFSGVLRAGLLARTIDTLPRLAVGGDDDLQRVVLCDPQGRLVARIHPDDRLETIGDDLRVLPDRTPPEIAAALALPDLRELSASSPARSERVVVQGAPYLVTFRALRSSQGWVAVVMAPEAFYTRDLRALQDRFLGALLVVALVVVVSAALAFRQLHGSLRGIVATTSQMRGFDFSPGVAGTPFRDLEEVMDGIERAKTSLRALGKYVPLDLVRELYEANREPQLGGEEREITLMFSDIEGFTGLSERLTPDELARALGLYLQAMTAGVRSTQGTVDKYIGDSVMAFWNAPTRHPDHPRRACDAALACIRATRELYESGAWRGLPRLFTRFGLHTTRAMVGHFGAPERLSYTALGDGVNLASRLEGLCKQYGVAVLASEAVVGAVGQDLAFRLVDKVVVKGKHEFVRVYELLGARAECDAALVVASRYEEALKAYFERNFEGALGLADLLPDDPPSRVLAQRCRTMIAHPPPRDWDGVYVATSK